MQLGDLDLRFPDVDWRRRHPGLVPFAERMIARSSLRHTQPPAGQAGKGPRARRIEGRMSKRKTCPPAPVVTC